MSQLQLERPNKRLARRRSAKKSLGVTCLKGTLGLGKNLALSILDVSETGVRLVVDCPLHPLQEIEVILSVPLQAKPIKALADVTWCVPAADGNYCIGASFRRRLNYADLSVLNPCTLASASMEQAYSTEALSRPYDPRKPR